jgi:thioredoxin 1
MMLPIVDEVAEEMQDAAVVAKLNVDENIGLAQKYGVMTIPTFIAFKNGEEIVRQVGVIPKLKLIEMVS